MNELNECQLTWLQITIQSETKMLCRLAMSAFGIRSLMAAMAGASPSAGAKSRFLALVTESSADLEKNPVYKVCDMLEGSDRRN